MIPHRALAPALAAALLLAACGGGSSDPGPAPECAVDLDCGASTTCRAHHCEAGRCVVADALAGTACDDGNACTQGDACQAGSCAAGAPVACTALDQCHLAGACDPATGQCSHPAAADGTACFDGDLCTLSDTCQAGACTGADPVTCLPSDQCHDAGACDAATGACSSPPKADGAACDDANACTQADACQAGTCTGAAPVTCGALDQCHAAGTCDPATGTCSNPAKADGAACNDGDACTQIDTCQAGTCAGAAPVTCAALDQCHLAGTCNPATGQCSNPAAPDGTACSDGDLCTRTDACQAGTCTGTSPVTCLPADQCHVAGACQPATGACSNPPAAPGVACNQGGGLLCDGAGACVSCLAAADCPPPGNECQVAACASGACGAASAPAGTVAATQQPGDCRQAQCDGNGGLVQVPQDADLPDDGNPCTQDACSGGVPSFTALPAGTSCGDGVCDGLGTCLPRPTVVAISPADGASAAGGGVVAVTFNAAMAPASLTGQVAFGPCAGSIQLSGDGFASCVPFAAAAPAMSGGNTVATLTPAPQLLLNRAYQLRVTAAATSAAGVPAGASVTQPAGFLVTPPATSGAQVVISQVYGGGGGGTSTYQFDFVELHNRGTTAASLAGLSLQYASATGSTWNTLALTGSIAPGGFFLVQLGAPGSGLGLPAPDQTWASTSMSSTAGKIALLGTTTPTSTGQACPTPGATLDFVGYGTSNCAELVAAPATSTTLALLRRGGGCADTDDNSRDLDLVTPAPRSSASPGFACGVPVANETGLPAEADYCVAYVAAPLSLMAGSTSPTLYGRVYEAGLTGLGAAPAGVRGQVGYGPATVNPEYGGWTWSDATWARSVGGQDDEFQAGFIAPAAGTWRYGWRFSVDGGASWTYCDADATGASGDAGAGANPGLTFDLQHLGVLTVTP